MTTTIETALMLLRRPVDQTGEPAPQTRGKGGQYEPNESTPLTEAELVDILNRLADERVTAHALLSQAADVRESLLLEAGSDDKILDLESQISRASLALERADRVEPALRERLGQVRFYNRGARWIADRDIAADRFAKFAAVEESFLKARAEWATTWNDLASRWPAAPEIMPYLPPLDRRRGAFRDQLERFREKVIVVAEPKAPLLRSLAAAIDYTKKIGRPPSDIPPDWTAECERAATGFAVVRTIVATTDDEGRPVPKNTVIQMGYERAHRAVQSGRAIFEET